MCPVELPLLSGEDLRSAVFNMCDHSAGGADGWQVHEIKVWPMFLFQKLADLLNDVEASGVWPDELLIQIISLIPKDAAGLDQRPITVATLVYRAGHLLGPRLYVLGRKSGPIPRSLAIVVASVLWTRLGIRRPLLSMLGFHNSIVLASAWILQKLLTACHITSSITALSPRVFLLPSPILGSQPFVVPKNTSSPPTALVGLSMSLVVFLKVMRWLVLA